MKLLGYPYAINGVYTISMTVFVLTLSITTMLEINPADPSAHVDVPRMQQKSI